MRRSLIIFIILAGIGTQLSAKQNPYVIKELKVEGAETLDKTTILNRAGLRVGFKVNDDQLIMGRAIQNLWAMDVFEEVSILHKEDDLGKIIIKLKVSPRLKEISYEGITKKEKSQLSTKIRLAKGRRVTPAARKRLRNRLVSFYRNKGFGKVKVDFKLNLNEEESDLKILIQKSKKFRIDKYQISGNHQLSEQKLKKSLRPLRKKLGVFRRSYDKEKFQEVLTSLTKKYESLGYADFKVKEKNIDKNAKGRVAIDIKVEEGEIYHIADIVWKGNEKYSDDELAKLTGLKSGLIYDPEAIESALRYKPDGTDVSSLYMNQGYLFFNVNQHITAVKDHKVYLELQVNEGEKAVIREVKFKGNTITKDPVILRNINTLPGDYFDRDELIRTQSNLATLGYFDPNTIEVKPIPRPNDGTVDLLYVLEEQPTDKYEFTGTLNGPTGFAGGLGIVLNNFSSKDLFKFKNWQTLPRGDGEKLAIRYNSSGKSYNSLTFNYSNPWLETKKPSSFFISTNYSRLINTTEDENGNSIDGSLKITGGSVGITTKLTWPDQFFSWTKSISFFHYAFDNYDNSLDIQEGKTNLLSFTNTLSRNRINHPFYPTLGSQFSASLSVTPPFSLFQKKVDPDNPYEFGEYFKILIDYSKYKRLVGKLTLKLGAHFGLIENYSNSIPLGPFERFHLGGTGITGRDVFRGNDLVGLRGYPAESLVPLDPNSGLEGGVIYQKINLELRMPISLNSTYSAYVYGFAEAGNTVASISKFNPTDLYRSAGVGARFSLPFVGQFGLDWAYGFDKLPGSSNPTGGTMHFTIGMPIR